MEHDVNMVLREGTEIHISNGRIIFKNKYLNFDYDWGDSFFCYNDKEIINNSFKDFIDGKLKKVEIVTKIEPDLTFVLMPKGTKGIRRLGEDFSRNEIYDSNSIRIELDLCLTGAYGGSFFAIELSEEETKEFIKQWLGQ